MLATRSGLWVALAHGLLMTVVLLGCSGSEHSKSGTSAGGSSSNPSGAGGRPTGPSAGGFPSGAINNSGFPDDNGVYVGATTDVDTKLPPLPQLMNVVARLNDDSAKITFDPFDGALDYRVYPLPKDDALDIKDDGHVVIKGATYRCAGDREAPPVMIDSGPDIKSDAVRTKVDNQMVGNYLRKLDDATLGYVYTGPGPGLQPVYVLGESDAHADVDCFFGRFAATRFKKYTTSKDERDALLAQAARDDGIAFYVPTDSASARQIYESTDAPGMPYSSRLYFPEGAEADKHSDKTKAFLVESKASENTQPLMRVYYSNICGMSHDELAVGRERFARIYQQGDTQPWWSLLWSGITEETTLVVEALDGGCPYPGHLSPSALPGVVSPFGDLQLVHEPYLTLDDAQATAPNNELFINGQHGAPWIWQGEKLTNNMQPASKPVPAPAAVARAFVKVKPNPHPEMDFFADFKPGTELEKFSDTPCDTQADCFASRRMTSANYDQMWTETEVAKNNTLPISVFGQVNGELWVTYADAGADTNGKFRLTAKQKASVDASKFLHVTMEVTSSSTARRYPQILVSDQDAPVQFRLDKGRSIIVQPRAEVAEYSFPVDYQIELCDHRAWDVNNQCPVYDLHKIPGKDGGEQRLAPNAEVGELTGEDQRLKYDAYISTKRVYLFLDDHPYACALLPDGAAPSGPVTVTWGDVLYHSAVDAVFAYHAAHLQIDTVRHFDNLGFSSGVDEPGWDETRLPCVPPIDLSSQ